MLMAISNHIEAVFLVSLPAMDANPFLTGQKFMNMKHLFVMYLLEPIQDRGTRQVFCRTATVPIVAVETHRKSCEVVRTSGPTIHNISYLIHYELLIVVVVSHACRKIIVK